MRGPTDNLPLAIGSILITVFALSLGDALIKQSSSSFVIWQIFVLRSCLAIPVLVLALMFATRPDERWPVAAGWSALRSAMLVVMWICYYLALPHLSLAVAAAVYYTGPIFITIFAALFTGDRIGRVGWLAIFLGFAGVLLILRPDAGDLNGAVLLPLLAAVFYGGAMILTRTKCRGEHPLVLGIVLNIAFVLVGLVGAAASGVFAGSETASFLFAPWSGMGAADWQTMAIMAAAVTIGSVGASVAYQNGPPSVVGTVDFAYVGFAAVWGLVLFAEFPDGIGLLGIGLILGAGMLSVRR